MTTRRRTRLRRALYVALALIVAAGGLAAARVATADTLRDDVTAAQYRAPASSDPMRQINLATVTVTLSKGQTAYLNGNLRFGKATTRILVDNQLQCFTPGGSSARKLLRAQNIYPDGNGSLSKVSLTSRFLLTASTAGTYRCDLSAWMRSLGAAGRVTVSSGFAEVAGKYSGTAAAATTGRSLVASGKAAWTPVVTGKGSVPGHGSLWQAPAGTTALSVFGDSQLTTCYGKDKPPCPQTPIDGKGSVARTSLVVTQFKKDGSVCDSSTTTLDTRIHQYVHHKPVYIHDPKVTIASGGGCVPLFSIYVKHQLRSGHPYYVHGPAEDGVISVFAT